MTGVTRPASMTSTVMGHGWEASVAALQSRGRWSGAGGGRSMPAERRDSGNCRVEMSLPQISLAIGVTLVSVSRPMFLKVEGENVPRPAISFKGHSPIRYLFGLLFHPKL